MNKIFNIDILDFGVNYTINGMLMTNKDGNSIIVVIPDEDAAAVENIEKFQASFEEWEALLNQLDTVEVEVVRGNRKVILRKSQRNIDGRISWKVFKRDGYKCRYCAADDKPLTVDHIITWEEGGATHEKNLLSSCRKCNKTRGNISYEEWLMSDYYKRVSQNLTEEVRTENLLIIHELGSLPRLKNKRSR